MIGQDGAWLEDAKNTILERLGVAEVTARRAFKKAEDQNLIQRGLRIKERTGRKKAYLMLGAANQR